LKLALSARRSKTRVQLDVSAARCHLRAFMWLELFLLKGEA
jgi:hypothetical protein